MFIDVYADKYQQFQGFKITLIGKHNKLIPAHMSFEQSTRSTYDIAMRDATIDALVTMEDLSLLEPGQIFYKDIAPTEMYIVQSINKTEQQIKSKNINAIKQNCYVSLERLKYNEETGKEEFEEIYKDIISFASLQNKDEKNFAAGAEENTNINIQIPKINVSEDYSYIVKQLDRIIIKNLKGDRMDNVKVESVDEYGVPGVIRIYGTFDTRTGE